MLPARVFWIVCRGEIGDVSVVKSCGVVLGLYRSIGEVLDLVGAFGFSCKWVVQSLSPALDTLKLWYPWGFLFFSFF